MNRKDKVFLKVNHKAIPSHGGVGYHDADRVMEREGLAPVAFPEKKNYLILKIAQLIYLCRSFIKIKRHSLFFVQLPLYHRMGRWLMKLLITFKDIRPVAFVMDIDGIRDGDEQLLQKEIAHLLQFDLFIAHNERMKQWILSLRPHAQVSCIEFFDFLILPVTPPRKKTNFIAFAGNLEKSSFLERLPSLRDCPSLFFHVYGPGVTTAVMQQPNVEYKGIIDPYRLPEMLTASFGLVWDGDSIDACTGSTGKYLQINSPHKLSLYIVSGMPVIAPCNTAAGDLVTKYRIGFCIHSLHELETTINALGDAAYQEMRMNTHRLAWGISTGKCLSAAIASFEGTGAR